MNIGNDKWRLSVDRSGIYVTLRFAVSEPNNSKPARGFVIKWTSRRLYAERHDGYRHALRLGPVYVRTYAKKTPVRKWG